MNFVLIGYRATGKTTLARVLAERLEWNWIDADVEIERRTGKTIAQIFADSGEPAFRDIESQVIRDLCRQSNLILAAGGGAPLREENRAAMRAQGSNKIVWLKASASAILARMTGDATTASRRPSLTDKDPLAEIEHLLAVREPIYRELADFEIETVGHDPEHLANEILCHFFPA